MIKVQHRGVEEPLAGSQSDVRLPQKVGRFDPHTDGEGVSFAWHPSHAVPRLSFKAF